MHDEDKYNNVTKYHNQYLQSVYFTENVFTLPSQIVGVRMIFENYGTIIIWCQNKTLW